MMHVQLMGTGAYLPKQIVTNDDLAKRIETNDEWIQTRTGIAKRHIASADETPVSMAAVAAEKAIARSQITASDIDLIIVATCTPEHFFPSTAAALQARIGARAVMAFDVSAACSGFVYGLSIAEQYIRQGAVRYALVVGAEVMSRAVDWNDRNTCVLFGDGAGACILGRANEPGILASQLYADGQKQDILRLPTGLYHDEASVVTMRGKELFKLAVESMTASVKSLLKRKNMSIEDVDWIVPHQANIRIIDAILDRLKFPKEKVIITIKDHANTSGASIPLALNHGIESEQIQKGQIVLLEAFGGGLTWGGALIRY